MGKTGFRGERKGILTPITYSPIRRLLPRRGGVVTSRERRKKRNVASHLFGKPPNPRRGTSWKKVTNLTPITYYVLAGHIPSCCWLPQRGGMWRVFYSVSPRTPEGGQAGKGDKPHPYHILRSRGVHTQLLLATSKREL